MVCVERVGKASLEIVQAGLKEAWTSLVEIQGVTRVPLADTHETVTIAFGIGLFGDWAEDFSKPCARLRTEPVPHHELFGLVLVKKG